MSSHHLIARGVELASVHFKDGGEVPTFEMPAWGILVLVITFLSFAAVSFAVSTQWSGDTSLDLTDVFLRSATAMAPSSLL